MSLRDENMKAINLRIAEIILGLGDIIERVKEDMSLVNQLLDISDRVLILYHNIAIKYAQCKARSD
jgi:hypothetical protein